MLLFIQIPAITVQVCNQFRLL